MLNFLLKSENAIIAISSLLGLLISALLSVELHEIAHGAVALWCGDRTAKNAGRISLNPVRHFELTGILMLLLAGFGWAKPVPVNPDNFKNRKRGIVLVSLAGIVTNIILVFVFFGLLNLAQAAMKGITIWTTGLELFILSFYYFSLYGMIINISLAAFNLLPIYPLDGFRVLEALFPNSKYCAFMRRRGMLILLILVAVSFILGRYIWFLDFIGMYLNWVRSKVLGLLIRMWGA